MFNSHVKSALRFSRRSCKILPRDISRRSCYTAIIMVGNHTSSNFNHFRTSYLHLCIKGLFHICTGLYIQNFTLWRRKQYLRRAGSQWAGPTRSSSLDNTLQVIFKPLFFFKYWEKYHQAVTDKLDLVIYLI